MTFEEAYRKHAAEIRRWVVWRFGEEMADDALQEGFLYAWLNWQTGETTQNLKAWLTGVTKYAALAMLRGGTTTHSKSTLKRDIAPFWGRAAAMSVPYAAESDPREQPAEQGLAIYVAQLRDHFGNLGPAQREVLTALAEGETAQEFANRSGRSQQAVSGAVRLGRQRLREALGDEAPHLWVDYVTNQP